jgi:hypothetical protein
MFVKCCNKSLLEIEWSSSVPLISNLDCSYRNFIRFVELKNDVVATFQSFENLLHRFHGVSFFSPVEFKSFIDPFSNTFQSHLGSLAAKSNLNTGSPEGVTIGSGTGGSVSKLSSSISTNKASGS